MSLRELHTAIERGTVAPDVALREARRLMHDELKQADLHRFDQSHDASDDRPESSDGDAAGDPYLVNQQAAPYPWALHNIVQALQYRPGWTFRLVDKDRGQGSMGLTLDVTSLGYDTYNPERGETYQVHHYFIVPAASYNAQSWLRWVLDRLIDIETHEACEFMVVDGKRPFAPIHAPGFDPYVVREVARIEDAETTFRGERKAGSQA